jgi:dUTP pyrophosphatase
MRIQLAHPDAIMPTKGTNGAGAWDIYMPTDGEVQGNAVMVDLGFRAAVPPGFAALLLPRSSAGAKFGVELNNTCGVIDSDYRGNWLAALKTKSGIPFKWSKGERVLQFLVVPVYAGGLELVESLEDTDRAGGFGSTGA